MFIYSQRTKLYHANNNTPKENELEISAVSTAQMLCDKTFEYLQHIVLLTPDREPMADQSMNTTTVQLGKPLNCTRITYRIWGEELFTEVEMTQRQLRHP